MGTTKVKKIVQGAMIASMFGVLSLLNTYTGSMFDIFICYIMVIPLVWYGYTYSLKDNVIVAVVAMIVIAMMGLPFFVIFSFSACITGLFIGEAVKRKASKGVLLVGTTVILFLNMILVYEVFSGLLQVNLISEVTELYKMLEQIIPFFKKVLSLNAFLSFIPLLLVGLSVMEMYIIIMLCQIVLPRLKVEFPNNFHIALMHIGRKTGIVLSLGWIISSILQNFMNIDHMIVSYIHAISFIALALQGLSFLSYLLIMKRKIYFMILVFIGFCIPVLNTIYIAIGMLDIFSDLRGKILYNNNND